MLQSQSEALAVEPNDETRAWHFHTQVSGLPLKALGLCLAIPGWDLKGPDTSVSRFQAQPEMIQCSQENARLNLGHFFG